MLYPPPPRPPSHLRLFTQVKLKKIKKTHSLTYTEWLTYWQWFTDCLIDWLTSLGQGSAVRKNGTKRGTDWLTGLLTYENSDYSFYSNCNHNESIIL